MELNIIQSIAVSAIPLIFAVTLHEVSHGWVAYLCGDKTAKFAGRLSINPIKHIDPFGTVILPLAMLFLTNFVFGWAKPVPIDPRNLRHPRRDTALVAAAGPISNLLMAFFWAGITKIGLLIVQNNPWLGVPLIYMGKMGVWINVLLGVLNLIPIPPLDGGRVLVSILPKRIGWRYAQIEPYGFLILILLLFSHVLNIIIMPIKDSILHLLDIIFHFTT